MKKPKFDRAAYFDLDGTLLGSGGSLVHDGQGHLTTAAVRAVIECHEHGIEPVIISGRRRAQNAELARLLGTRSFISEAGTVLDVDGETIWLGSFEPDRYSIFTQIKGSPVPNMLLDLFQGTLEYHDPWNEGREATHLLRGLVDVAEANELIARRTWELQLVDNGVLAEHTSRLELPKLHAYHLMPTGASKADAISLHRAVRGYDTDATFSVGDSRLDLETAGEVGTCWLVANALLADPSLASDALGIANVRVTNEGHGHGVLEAVLDATGYARG